MIDQWLIQDRLTTLFEPYTKQELERISFLMAVEAEAAPRSLRRRLGGALVRLGTRLDPEVRVVSPAEA